MESLNTDTVYADARLHAILMHLNYAKERDADL